jgi:hypothetical protein
MGDLTRANLASCVVEEFGKELNAVLHVDSDAIVKQEIEYNWSLEEVVYTIYIKDNKGKEVETILPIHIFNSRHVDVDDLVETIMTLLDIDMEDEDKKGAIYQRIGKSGFYQYYRVDK